MKKVWKWVIGIVIGLVVVAALVGGVFLMRSRFNGFARVVQDNRPSVQVPGTGKVPYNDNDQGQRGDRGRIPGMMPFGGNAWGGGGYPMRGPGMMGFGRMMPFVGILGCLVALGFITMVVLGILWLVRRQRTPTLVEPPAATAAPASVSTVTTHPCKKCGQPVQGGLNYCPNCGRKQ